MHVAEAAVAAAQQRLFLVRHIQIHQHAAGLLVAHQRSRRNLDNQTFAALARGAALLALLAVGRGIGALVAEVQQRVHTLGGHEHYIAAASAVTAVGAALLNVLFAVERHAAVAAVARLYPDCNYVNK